MFAHFYIKHWQFQNQNSKYCCVEEKIFDLMQNMTMVLLGSSRDLKWPHILWSLQGIKIWTPNPVSRMLSNIWNKIWSLNMGSFFGPSIGTISMWSKIWSLIMGPYFGPSYPWTLNRSTLWTFMKVQNLDLGLKVLILQESPHRSMKDHIGTMVMFYKGPKYHTVPLQWI